MRPDSGGQSSGALRTLQVVPLTPPGRGAIATLLVEGPGAEDAVQVCFRARGGRPLASHTYDRLVFGHFTALGEGDPSHGEEVVIRRHSAESVEVHCHGGFAAVSMIQEALVRQGCRRVDWTEWVAECRGDPIAAAARRALADARTERTAKLLLAQYEGALRRAIDVIGEALDRRDTACALRQIEALLAHAQTGLHLVEPWRVVLAGPPNVGKSSLVNALLGYARSLVHPMPGTTRDVVTAMTALDGWPVELSDTAGLHSTTEAVEQAGMEMGRRQLATADLVVLVFDASQPWGEQDQQLADHFPHALRICNKTDLVQLADGSRPAGLATSALTGEGIESLMHEIGMRLVPHPPAAGEAVPFTTPQIAAIEVARDTLLRGDVDSAVKALDRLGK